MHTEICKLLKCGAATFIGLGCLALCPRALAQPYEILHHFSGAGTDGRFPVAGLLEASDGALYGTTVAGGSDDSGTVFKMNKDGTEYAVLRHFAGGSGDGAGPLGTLIEAGDGALYGTTHLGGSNNRGTVFTLNKDGTGYTTLVTFGSDPSDGATPFAGVLEGSDGALYGTTIEGGIHNNSGTVFTLNKDGSGYAVLKTFYEFAGDGVAPYGALIEGTDGALYGSTYWGGRYGEGSVYTLNKDGTGFAVIQSFGGEPFDGTNPYSAVIEGSDGALYGTCLTGEEINGTVYRVNKDGTGYEILRRFNGFDGSHPYATVVEGSDGALYGTTGLGGPRSGTVYTINKDGTGFLTLHGFGVSGDDGREPDSAVLFASDSALFGTTFWGGSSGDGVVFRLSIAAGR